MKLRTCSVPGGCSDHFTSGSNSAGGVKQRSERILMPAVTPATRLPLHSDGTAAVGASESTASGAGGCQRDQQIIRQRRPVAALELSGSLCNPRGRQHLQHDFSSRAGSGKHRWEMTASGRTLVLAATDVTTLQRSRCRQLQREMDNTAGWYI